MKSIIFRKNGEVLSGIKVGAIFLCVYLFSNRGAAIIGDRAIIRSFTVTIKFVRNMIDQEAYFYDHYKSVYPLHIIIVNPF